MQANNEAVEMIQELDSTVRRKEFSTERLNRVIELSIALRDRHLKKLEDGERQRVLDILRTAKVQALSHDSAYTYLEHLQLLEKDIAGC
ncbi:MAG: hypothetical protein WC488_02055 [Candidatus Micrarchaeia archaeon]